MLGPPQTRDSHACSTLLSSPLTNPAFGPHVEKANVNKSTTDSQHGRTALHWAAHAGMVEVVTVLLDAGAILEARDKSGATALSTWAGDPTPGLSRMLSPAAFSSPQLTSPAFEPQRGKWRRPPLAPHTCASCSSTKARMSTSRTSTA